MTPQEFYALEPIERVMSVFQFPETHTPTYKQAESVNQFGDLDGHGCFDKPGTGKTFTMTLHALLSMCQGEAKQWVVLCPPAVIPNWVNWLRRVSIKASGKPITAVAYAGTPKQRAEIDLGVHFAVMSYEIFKGDFERLSEYYLNRPHRVGLIADEAHKIKNMDTANFKHVRAWKNEGVVVKLATGTPVSTPLDIYTYTRFKNPEAYRNKKDFYDQHVEEEDAYERVVGWKNLELARHNLSVNATQTLLSDVAKDLPEASVEEWIYDLDPSHMKIYNQLAEEQLAIFEQSGQEVTALNEQALIHKVQQLIINLPHFSGIPDNLPAGLGLIHQWMEELGDEKLILVANYQLSNELFLDTLQQYGIVAIYGKQTGPQKQASIRRFIEDKSCRLVTMQPEAGGVGVDGLQHVCHSMLFMECPTVPRQFDQAIGRIIRTGQKLPVQVRIAMANKTLQVSRFRKLLSNDSLVAQVQRTQETLRDMIYGRERPT